MCTKVCINTDWTGKATLVILYHFKYPTHSQKFNFCSPLIPQYTHTTLFNF